MPTDIRLDQGDGTFLELDARVVKVLGSDFMLDQPDRRRGGGPHRRALVHDQNDGLTINFAGDFPGGITLVDVNTLQVRGDITFGVPGASSSEHGRVLTPVSLSKTISELESQINALSSKVASLEARK